MLGKLDKLRLPAPKQATLTLAWEVRQDTLFTHAPTSYPYVRLES
jgi:hypothetical protein